MRRERASIGGVAGGWDRGVDGRCHLGGLLMVGQVFGSTGALVLTISTAARRAASILVTSCSSASATAMRSCSSARRRRRRLASWSEMDKGGIRQVL